MRPVIIILWSSLPYFVLLSITIGKCENALDEVHEIYKLPQFVQLDDYDKCLAKRDGKYCFGTFRIQPNGSSTEKYDFIKKYSDVPHHYDRTNFRRGYCVSDRCPSETNISRRFEKCVQESQKDLNVVLDTKYAHSCQTKQNTARTDVPILSFLLILFLILTLNTVGTIYYDVLNHGELNQFWKSWSIKSNWQQLVEPFRNEPDTLAPIQGIRVILTSLIIFLHLMGLLGATQLYNVEFIEQMIISPIKVFGAKGASIVQVFIALSSLLTAYNLLQMSRKQKLHYGILRKQIIKRFFRIAPVHILFVAFGATLWPLLSDGPTWPVRIQTQRNVCRNAFWTHILHVNNFFTTLSTGDTCLIPTWSLAADIQIQIVALVVTILLSNSQSKLKLLSGLLISSIFFIIGLAYFFAWTPLIYQVTGKHAVTLGAESPSFVRYYYVAPWGSLPSCIVGLIFAHIYFQWRQGDFKLADHKWLAISCQCSVPLFFLWIAAGFFTQNFKSPILLAVYVGIERPVFCGLTCFWIFSLIIGENRFLKDMLSWRGWLPLGKLSLSVLMVHWIIIESSLHSRHVLIYVSYFNIIKEYLATLCFSYILAIPVTLLVEMPVMNTYTYYSTQNIKKVDTSVPRKLHNKGE